MTTEHAIHPYCAAWPDLPPDELKALADNIYERGQDLPIYRYKKQIIDGKNRFAACQLAGVTPNFEEWRPSKPDDPEKIDQEIYDLTIASNMRRHMTTGQRATVAAKLATMKHGDNQHTRKEDKQTCATSQNEAAEKMKVSRRSVTTATKVLNEGSEPLVDAMSNGTVTPSDAAKIVDLPKRTQTAAVAKVVNGKSPTVAKAAGIASDPEADRMAAIMGTKKTTPTPVSQFDPDELEAKAKSLVVDKTKPLAERITQQNKMLESFCRLLVKTFDDNLPSDPWLDEGQVEIAKSQLKSCCGAIRVAKAHSEQCPRCDGNGCKSCRKCGYLPKNDYQLIGGK